LPYGIGQTIIFSSARFSFVLSIFFFPRLISAVANWMSAIIPQDHTIWCGRSAYLECRSKTCCTRLGENTGRKKVAKNRHLGRHHRTNLSGYIFATKAHSDNRKNLLSSNTSSRCPHSMANFGPIAAEMSEIGLPVWGTPANFNGFRVLAALLHRSQAVSVGQTLRR